MPKIHRGFGGVNRLIKRQLRGVNGTNREVKEQWRGVSGTNRRVFLSKYIELLYGNMSSFTGSVTANDNGSTITLSMDGTPTNGVETYAYCYIRGLSPGDVVEVTIAYTRTNGNGTGFFRDIVADFYQWSTTVSGMYSGTVQSGDYAVLALTSWATGTYSKQTLVISNIKVNGVQIYPL